MNTNIISLQEFVNGPTAPTAEPTPEQAPTELVLSKGAVQLQRKYINKFVRKSIRRELQKYRYSLTAFFKYKNNPKDIRLPGTVAGDENDTDCIVQYDGSLRPARPNELEQEYHKHR